MHRLFVALPISPELQSAILNWEKQMAVLPVRWLAGENLHITLVPPWEEANREGTLSRLKNTVGPGAVNLNFTQIDFGPTSKQPRLVWATAETPPALLKLKASIERSLDLPVPKRNFLTHLTLARFQPGNFKNFPPVNLPAEVNWKDKVSSFVLMESHLRPEGVAYKILKEFRFGT